MKKLFLLLSFCHFFTDASPPLEKLTLQQAIEKGTFERNSLQAIEAEAQALRYKGKAQMSKWLPQHRLTAGIDHAYGKTGECSTPSFFELSTKQLLASGVSPYDNYAITRGQKESVEAELLAKKDSLQFGIEKSFLQAWLINEQRKQINSFASATKTTFSQEKAEYKQNIIDKPTWQNREAIFISNITEVENYNQLYSNAQADLSFSMGIFDYKELKLIWTPQRIQTLEKISWYINKAFEHRKELKIIDSQIKTKKIEIAKAIKGYLPSVSAFASVYLQDGHPDRPKSSKNGGLQVSWDIGDGVSQYFDAENLRSLQMQLKKNRISIKKKIKNEVVISYNNIVTQMRTLASKGFNLRAAHAIWKKKDQEKKLGLITKADYNQALDRLQQERFTWISTRIEYEIKYRTLAFASGYGI